MSPGVFIEVCQSKLFCLCSQIWPSTSCVVSLVGKFKCIRYSHSLTLRICQFSFIYSYSHSFIYFFFHLWTLRCHISGNIVSLKFALRCKQDGLRKFLLIHWTSIMIMSVNFLYTKFISSFFSLENPDK